MNRLATLNIGFVTMDAECSSGSLRRCVRLQGLPFPVSRCKLNVKIALSCIKSLAISKLNLIPLLKVSTSSEFFFEAQSGRILTEGVRVGQKYIRMLAASKVRPSVRVRCIRVRSSVRPAANEVTAAVRHFQSDRDGRTKGRERERGDRASIIACPLTYTG